MMQIRPIDMRQHDEALAASEVQSVAFRSGAGYQQRLAQIEKAKKENTLLPDPKDGDPVAIPWGAFLDDELIAMVTAIDFSMRFEGQNLPMCGIGGVATRPEYRRRGAIRQIMRKIFQACRQRGDVFSYLYPFSFAYYHQFGYDFGCRRLDVKIPLQDFSKFPPAGKVRQAAQKDHDSIKHIYQAFITDTNGAVLRSGQRWSALLDKDPYIAQRFTYVWSDEQNQDRAYFIFEKKEDPLKPWPGHEIFQVLDWAFTDSEAMRGMLGFISRFPISQYKFVQMRFPLHVPLETLFSEVDTIERKLEAAGQIRVLDIAKALQSLRFPAWLEPFSLTLDVTDAFLPDNSGLYRIDFNSTGNRVDVIPAAKRGGEVSDLILDVEPLASLLLGSRDLAELLRLDAVTIPPAVPQLKQEQMKALFRIRPHGIYDYF